MSSAVPNPRAIRGLFAATGIGLALAGPGLRIALPNEVVWFSLETPLIAAGLIVILTSLLIGRRIHPVVAMRMLLVIWGSVMACVVAEVGFRTIGFDFSGQAAALNRLPPYYREPRKPSGTAFFSRHGPEIWTGQPIRTWLTQSGYLEFAPSYEDEATVTVHYDASGFRQHPPLTDWEIAIAGDSFVELGCLADDDLFTTRIAEATGLRVRNLGVCNTGPFTHLHYLETYGLAPSLRDTVIVLYEGNDLQDITWEHRAIVYHLQTGKRGYREIHRQISPMGALLDAWIRPPRMRTSGGAQNYPYPIHLFSSRHGDQPLTLEPYPPDPAELGANVVASYEEFLKAYAEFGRRHGVSVTIAFMPTKPRVLDGLVRPAHPSQESEAPWKPTPLPAWVRAACERHGIRFHDLTPALQETARHDRVCPFNLLAETHLNAVGSAAVARAFLPLWMTNSASAPVATR